MPLPLVVPPPAWEMYLPPSETARLASPAMGFLADVASLPLDLLKPLGVVFGSTNILPREGYLSGLVGEKVLGAGILPASRIRPTPLFWIGVMLSETGRFFACLRRGCWVCGFPEVGRGRELLRLARLDSASGLNSALGELDQAAQVSTKLYFNFHYDEPEAACARVYVLDAGVGRLHGFAISRSALAPAKMK